FLHFRFDQIVAMNPFLAQLRERHPTGLSVIIPTERRPQKPWANDDQIIRPRVTSQTFCEKIDRCLALSDFRPEKKWQRNPQCDDKDEAQNSDPLKSTKSCDD